MPNATRQPLRSMIRPLKSLTPRQKQRQLEEREEWLRDVDLLQAFDEIFDFMPEYRIFLKRRAGEIMFLSRAMVRTLRVDDEAALIGAQDHDVTPGPLADLYYTRDEEVLRTGKSINGVMEVWFTREGIPQWFLCHKAPLRNRQGQIIGIIGFLKEYQDMTHLPVDEPLDQLLTFIRENLSSELRIRDLAEMSNLSVRQLERIFQTVFGMSPRKYITKLRIRVAVRLLLETNLPLDHIALETGFCDQSALTYYFRRELGVTPYKFRKAAALWSSYNLRVSATS
jgi:AraC-like DNA-binding protein